MFEDILGKDKYKEPRREKICVNSCPFCGSKTIEEDSGIFINSKEYVLTMACQACSGVWKIHYNEDLDVTDIKY